MYYIETEASFDAAHFLAGYDGKCANIHGHRWRVVLAVRGEELEADGPKRGMLKDFGDVKKELKAEADALDHSLLIERGSLRQKTMEALQEEGFRVLEFDFRPTAEEFARYFYERMKARGYETDSVRVYETPNNLAVYREIE